MRASLVACFDDGLALELIMSEEELIDEQYQLVMCIASGSTCQVWEVVEKSSARHMAMKLLKAAEPTEFKENKAQLKRESEILKSFDHPLIVKFEQYSSNRDHTYMLMEHFRASNLKLQIKADTNKVHLRVRQLFEGVCAALSHVHQKGFIHRDIKPDNVLLNKAGEVRLCDFSLSSKQVTGLGKMLAGKQKTIQGTRTYIAPETIRRDQPSFQTDLYSLGVLFFEVLTCRTPFQAPSPEELLQKHLRTEAPNPSEFNTNVSPEMDRIIAKLLKKKPADRPASVDEVLGDLKRIRIFKEDIIDEVAAKKASADDDALAMLSEIRLDSRADAKLKHMLETNPEFAEKFRLERVVKAEKKSAANARHLARVKVAEDAEDARTKRLGPKKKDAPAAPAPPMGMPMQMPGFPPGYPGYPQGFPQYPQPQMPMMPMQMPPGMVPPMMGAPQFPSQPQMAVPQPVAQQPVPQAPHPPASQAPTAPPQKAQSAEPPVRQVAPPNVANPPPSQQSSQPAPVVQQAKAPEPPVRQAAPVAPPSQPQPAPRPAAPPSPAPRSAPAAKSATPVPARPASKPMPPTAPAGDLDFMTDLPDVL